MVAPSGSRNECALLVLRTPPMSCPNPIGGCEPAELDEPPDLEPNAGGDGGALDEAPGIMGPLGAFDMPALTPTSWKSALAIGSLYFFRRKRPWISASRVGGPGAAFFLR